MVVLLCFHILCCCAYYCGLTKFCLLQCVFYDKLMMLKWLLMILVTAIQNTHKNRNNLIHKLKAFRFELSDKLNL
jgi:hypothetical protein